MLKVFVQYEISIKAQLYWMPVCMNYFVEMSKGCQIGTLSEKLAH